MFLASWKSLQCSVDRYPATPSDLATRLSSSILDTTHAVADPPLLEDQLHKLSLRISPKTVAVSGKLGSLS